MHLGLDVFMPEAGQPVKSVLECGPVKCAVVVNSSSRPVKIHIYIYICLELWFLVLCFSVGWKIVSCFNVLGAWM